MHEQDDIVRAPISDTSPPTSCWTLWLASSGMPLGKDYEFPTQLAPDGQSALVSSDGKRYWIVLNR